MPPGWFARHKLRFRRKPVEQPESTAAPEIQLTSHAPAPQPESSTTNGAPEGQSSPTSIWDTAYDNVRLAESKLVDAYESILAASLGDAIEQRDATKRWLQMERLAQAELDKAVKRDGAKKAASQVIQVVLAVNAVVKEALQTLPPGVLAWTGVCFSLQLVLNPLQENQKFHDGLAHIIKRMQWYYELEGLLLRRNRIDPQPSEGLQAKLQGQILSLYEALLSFLMKGVCVCHQSKVVTFLRDAFKLDDWAESLKALEKAEDLLHRDHEVYSDMQTLNGLDQLIVFSEKQEAMLGDVQTLLQKQVAVKLDKKNNECLQSLWVTDPRHDKTRIEEGRGGLLADAYRWVLQSDEFQRWRDGQENRLLWIRGDPGKGKTMLVCGIINELETSFSGKETISYFFCESANSRLNHSTAVLRGLIHMLAHQQQSLIRHIRKDYDHVGRSLFTDTNAWNALCNILSSMLQDPELEKAYLIIDGLDECKTGLEQLTKLIIKQSAKSPSVKWIVTSRNWQQIEEIFDYTGQNITLSLELNAEAVGAAVAAYIRHKVDCLTRQKRYNPKTRDAVQNHLFSNAQDTFLWVALVCKSLEETGSFVSAPKLESFPPGLDSLYKGMMRQVLIHPYAGDCMKILACAAAVFRPLSLKELGANIEIPEWADPSEDISASLETFIKVCGSFLTTNRGVVYFVHQTAKDFLLDHAANVVFASGIEEVHQGIVSRSVQGMQETLSKDMYSLREPGFPIQKVEKPDPDPLGAIGYACVHWVDHLEASQPNNSPGQDILQGGGAIDAFLRKKLLYWLESLSLLRLVPDAILALAKLAMLLQPRAEGSQLAALIQDACRFALYNKWAIENAPLQLYASALIFSPTGSITRQVFAKEEPDWITTKPIMEQQWDSCLQTIEGHPARLYNVVFSHDGSKVLSTATDHTVRIWDRASGKCLLTLEGHTDLVGSVAFSHDSRMVVSGSNDSTVKIWEAVGDRCLRTLQGHTARVTSVAFSHDSILVVSGSVDQTIRVWDRETGTCRQVLKGHEDSIHSVRMRFSDNTQRVVSTSLDRTSRTWDPDTGKALRLLDYTEDAVELLGPAIISPDLRLVASRSLADITIWEQATRQIVGRLEGHRSLVVAMAFSHDGKMIASGASDKTIKVWETRGGSWGCLWTLERLGDNLQSVAFSPDNKVIATAFSDGTIKIWDLALGQNRLLDRHSANIEWVSFSRTYPAVVSASTRDLVVWDASDGESLDTFKTDKGHSAVFSKDGAFVAIPTGESIVRVFEIVTGDDWTFEGHTKVVSTVAFSHDSDFIVSGSIDRTIRVWHLASRVCKHVLEGHQRGLYSVVFSNDDTRIASAAADDTVRVWDAATGECLQTLETLHRAPFPMVFSQDNDLLITGTLSSVVKVWQLSTATHVETRYDRFPSSFAFSQDSKLIVLSHQESVTICDSKTLVGLQTFHLGTALRWMAFDNTNSLLSSHIGTIVVPPSSSSSFDHVVRRGFSLSEDKMWITRDGENLLWLPSDYRPLALNTASPAAMAVKGSWVAIGCASGRVIMLSFDGQE